jgi:hypothetical protein
MSWWEYVIIAGPLLFGIYVFVVGTGYLTMVLSQGKNSAADSMYNNFAESLGNQRRHGRQPGEEWKDVDRAA